MTNLETKFEDLPEDFAGLGGRGMTSTIVAKDQNFYAFIMLISNNFKLIILKFGEFFIQN